MSGNDIGVPASECLVGVPLDQNGVFSNEADESDLSALLRDVRRELTQAHAFTVTVCNALETISSDGCPEAGLTLIACGNILWDQMERLEWAVENGRIVGDRVTVPRWVEP